MQDYITCGRTKFNFSTSIRQNLSACFGSCGNAMACTLQVLKKVLPRRTFLDPSDFTLATVLLSLLVLMQTYAKNYSDRFFVSSCRCPSQSGSGTATIFDRLFTPPQCPNPFLCFFCFSGTCTFTGDE